MPHDKTCTVNNCHVAKTMPNQLNSGARDHFQTIFFFTGTQFKLFFYRDENQNTSILQGRKSYLNLKKKYIYHKRLSKFDPRHILSGFSIKEPPSMSST